MVEVLNKTKPMVTYAVGILSQAIIMTAFCKFDQEIGMPYK